MLRMIFLSVFALALFCFSEEISDSSYIVEKAKPVQDSTSEDVLKGTNELFVSGGLAFLSGSNSESNSNSNIIPTLSVFQFNVQYGRFIFNPLEIGALLSMDKTNYSDIRGNYGAFISFHFTDVSNSRIPFLTTNYQLSFGDSMDQNSYLFGAGMKNILGNACMVIEAYYSHMTIGTYEFNLTGVGLGMSLLL